MKLLKSKLRLLSLVFIAAIRVQAAANENLYPIAEVSGEGWINVRRSDSPSAPVMGRLRKGDTFAAQAASERFRILDGPLAGGYIAAPFVTLTSTQAPLIKSMADGLLIRAYPGKNGRIVANINNGAYFTGELSGEWYTVKSGPFAGRFINAQFAKPIHEAGSAATAARPMIVRGAALESAPEAAAPVATPAIEPEPPPAPVPAPADTPAPAVSPSMAEAFLIKSDSVSKKGDSSNTVEVPAVTDPPTEQQTNPTVKSTAAAPVETAVSAKPPPATTWDEAKERRFNEGVDKIFKKKKTSAESNQVTMPVFIDQNKSPSGYVYTQVIGSKEIQVDSTEFFKILRQAIADPWFEKPEIKALMPKDSQTGPQWTPVQAFKDSDVNIYYDDLKLEVRVIVPPEARPVESLSITSGQAIFGKQSVERQSFVSSYININATETIDSRLVGYNDRRSPLQAQIENGTNVGNFVLEAFGTYTEQREDSASGRSAFIRQDVRVTRDFTGLLSRGSVGDVVYPVQSFQVYRPLKGASFYRQYAMAPSKLTYPTGNREIFLKNNSKVYIYVNNQLQKVVELPAGRHQLKDFQYTSGMNDVRFEIVDQFGQTEIIDFSYTASTDLLKPGFQQFSYAAGTPSSSNPTSGERVYDDTNDTFSAFHRYGFSDHFTGGVNGQLDSKQSIFGLEGNFSLKKGYLKLESALSGTEDVGSGYALGSTYNYIDYKGPDKTQRSLNAGLVYRSDRFLEFGTITAPGVARRLNLSVGHSRGITKMMGLNFGINYVLNRSLTTDASNSYQLRLGLSNRWSNGISGNVTAAHSKLSSGKDEISLTAFLIWTFPKQKQTLSAYANSADSSSRIGWNYNPSTGADSASYQANLREDKLEKGYGGGATVNGNRARVTALHEVVLTKIDEPSTVVKESERADNVTTIQLGTALVFAGGRFGIGRPVSDSFAIVAPRKSLKGQKLMINPDSEENYLAKTGWLGPAVVPEISSYNPTTLVIGAKDLPLGVSIPQDHFNLYPRYKSGYGFPLGNDANVYLSATIINSEGQPVGMASGIATNLDDSSQPVITVFTTRRGVLQSEGFKAGRFKIEIEANKYEPVEIVIPKDAKEEYSLGTLKLKERQE